MEFIKARNLPMYSHLKYLASMSFDGRTLLIEMERGIHLDRLLEKRDELEGLCRDFFQGDIRLLIREASKVECDNGGDLKGGSDTFIKDVLEIFNGRVYKDIRGDEEIVPDHTSLKPRG